MIETIVEFNKQIADLRVKFEAYIADQSIPLEDRWDAFVTAPQSLKDFDYYMPQFKSLPEDFIMYDGPIHMDRHQTMDTDDLVDNVQVLKDCNYECYQGINIDALKEEILALNLGSFTYDW